MIEEMTFGEIIFRHYSTHPDYNRAPMTIDDIFEMYDVMMNKTPHPYHIILPKEEYDYYLELKKEQEE